MRLAPSGMLRISMYRPPGLFPKNGSIRKMR
jgi:hypothetical protein